MESPLCVCLCRDQGKPIDSWGRCGLWHSCNPLHHWHYTILHQVQMPNLLQMLQEKGWAELQWAIAKNVPLLSRDDYINNISKDLCGHLSHNKNYIWDQDGSNIYKCQCMMICTNVVFFNLELRHFLSLLSFVSSCSKLNPLNPKFEAQISEINICTNEAETLCMALYSRRIYLNPVQVVWMLTCDAVQHHPTNMKTLSHNCHNAYSLCLLLCFRAITERKSAHVSGLLLTGFWNTKFSMLTHTVMV